MPQYVICVAKMGTIRQISGLWKKKKNGRLCVLHMHRRAIAYSARVLCVVCTVLYTIYRCHCCRCVAGSSFSAIIAVVCCGLIVEISDKCDASRYWPGRNRQQQ